MELTDIENWLRTTILGIITLGAIGSIAAVLIIKLVTRTSNFLYQKISGLNKKVFTKQAYMLGYTKAIIENRENEEHLISFLAFRSLRALIAFVLFAGCVIVFLTVLLVEKNVVLSFTTYLPVFLGFLSFYWFYYEYEFVYRMYLTYWKKAYQNAEDGFKKRESELLEENGN